jgi:DNA-binding GntR family transcriptional regulator
MVGERLRAQIVGGQLTPGSQLHEVELAESFGVSRGPIREALQRLIQEGLLRSEPHRGVFVPVMSADDVEDIYLVRQALETTAARQVLALSRGEETADALSRICREMERARTDEDWPAMANLDLDFHTALVAAANSPRLERSFTTVISETRLCLAMFTTSRADLVEEHQHIADVLRSGDLESTLAVLSEHFVGAVASLKERLELSAAARAVG